jgi:hypothetical protein
MMQHKLRVDTEIAKKNDRDQAAAATPVSAIK